MNRDDRNVPAGESCSRFPRSFVGPLDIKGNDGVQSGIACINQRQMRLYQRSNFLLEYNAHHAFQSYFSHTLYSAALHLRKGNGFI
jgi:hypothetical protein